MSHHCWRLEINTETQLQWLLSLPDEQLRKSIDGLNIEVKNFRLISAIAPHSILRVQEVLERDSKFFHYTSVEAAKNIVENNSIWLRNARLMDDYSEIKHGMDAALEYFDSEAANPFWNTLENAHPNITGKIKKYFWGHKNNILDHTYITCISEQKTQSELQNGRKYMWQHYGQNLAIVINPGPSLRSSNALDTWTYPVIYTGDSSESRNYFQKTTDGVVANFDLINSMCYDDVFHMVFFTLVGYCIALKRNDFSEEREWRIAHCPKIWPNEKMQNTRVDRNGSTEEVYLLPFKNSPEEELTGATLPELVETVILGPMDDNAYKNNRDKLIEIMRKANIPNPEEKIVRSSIILSDS
jgi:hypothetical protein